MSIFSRLDSLANSFHNANKYAQLFSLTDAELAARGMTREDVKRAFVDSIGNR